MGAEIKVGLKYRSRDDLMALRQLDRDWIFDIIENDTITISAKENFGYEKIDMGIAMLHFQQGAQLCGCKGEWRRRNGIWRFLVEEKDENTQI